MLYYEVLLSHVIYPEDYRNVFLFEKKNPSFDQIKIFMEREYFTDRLIPNAMIEFQIDVSKDLEIIDYIPTAHSIEISEQNPTAESLSVEYYIKCVFMYSEDGKEINAFKLKHPSLYEKFTVEEY